MFIEALDFSLYPWDTPDPETGNKEIYIIGQTILRKMYKLKHLYEQQSQTPQPNSNNWNYGSPVPSQLMGKKS